MAQGVAPLHYPVLPLRRVGLPEYHTSAVAPPYFLYSLSRISRTVFYVFGPCSIRASLSRKRTTKEDLGEEMRNEK